MWLIPTRSVQVEIKGKDKALQKEIAMLEEKDAEQVRYLARRKRADFWKTARGGDKREI